MLEVLQSFLGSWNAFFVGLLTLVALLYYNGTKNFDYWKKRGITGPPTFPFLGNTISLFKPIPLLHSEYLERYGKVFGVFQLKKPMLFICDPELIKRVLVQDFNNFRNRSNTQQSRSKVMEKNLVMARDETWKRIRSIVSPTFTASKLKKMEHLMKGCSSQMIEALEKVADSKEPVIWANEKMGNFTMDVIAKCAFATEANASKADVASDNQFIHNARAAFNTPIVAAIARMALPKFLLQILQKIRFPGIYTTGGKFFEDMARHIIQERREAKKKGIESSYDDMLQLMINAEHDENNAIKQDEEDKFDEHHVNLGKEEIEKEKALFQNITGKKFLTETETVAQAIVFFLAGYETTAATLSYCIYSLATNPKVQKRLYQEVKEAAADDPSLSYATVMKLHYLDAVLSETLRMYPPAMAINRETTTDYHIPEYNVTLEKNNGVIIPIRAMHYCAEYFPEPEKFRPERFLPENREREVKPYTYLPFGGGPRNCVGMRFALAEAKLGLAEMISRFEFKTCPQTPSKLDPLLSFILFKTHPVMVSVHRR